MPARRPARSASRPSERGRRGCAGRFVLEAGAGGALAAPRAADLCHGAAPRAWQALRSSPAAPAQPALVIDCAGIEQRRQRRSCGAAGLAGLARRPPGTRCAMSACRRTSRRWRASARSRRCSSAACELADCAAREQCPNAAIAAARPDLRDGGLLVSGADNAPDHSTLQHRDRPRVLLVAGESWIGFARIPRLLRDAGCHLSLLCHPSCWAAQSGYVDELLPAPRGAAATLDVLEPLVAAREFHWVILGDDPILRAAVERPAVAHSWRFPVAGSGGRPRVLTSKTAFAQLAVRAQLPFPPSAATLGEHATAAARRIGFPVIVKPEFGSGGHGIFRADGPAELRELHPGAAAAGPAVR